MRFTFQSIYTSSAGKLFLVLCLSCFFLSAQAQITVTNNSNDELVVGSLPWAVDQANTNPGTDDIVFSASFVITIVAPLVINSGNGDATNIDGDFDADGTPDVTILRSGTGYSGIVVNAANCVIANLNIQGFGASPRAAIELSGASATGNSIIGNHIGTNLAGTATGTANFRGVAILLGATGNSIGDGSTAGQNVISNNTFGVYINGSDNNTVTGNIIGLDITGSNILGNGGSGVEVFGSDGTLIGINGDLGNVISGNNQEGISLTSSTNTEIVNNYLGLNVAGTADLGNGREGIFIDANSTPTQVGDGTVGGRNVSSGNGFQGLEIASDNNSVIGNYFGLNAAGTAAIPNTSFGIWIAAGATGNTIGNGTVGGRNVISGNGSHGVQMSDGPNYLYGNYIGLDESGAADVGNTGIGVFVTGGTNSKIGDAIAEYGNVISNNTNGLQINVAGIEVYGNTLGLNAAGTATMGNSNNGISLTGTAQNVQIGNGTALGANLISGNASQGIGLNGPSVSSNTITGNNIGVQSDLVTAAGNGANGVLIENDANANTISSNLIANNGDNGIETDQIFASATENNVFSQNSIFSNTNLGISVINSSQNGVSLPTITSTLDGLIVGTADAGATIEIFADTNTEGEQYLDFTTADGAGDWSHQITVASINSGLTNISATQTSSNNTSEFSSAALITSSPFITTWSTTDGQITIPTFGGAGYDYNITWTNLTSATQGDGSTTGATGNYLITGLNNTDIYQIEITGSFPRIYFNNGGHRSKIQTIEQWGDIQWQDMTRAFFGCNNLTSNSTDTPDLSQVESLLGMFRSATTFNSDISDWDVSNVTDMSLMFQSASAFNNGGQPLDWANTGAVINMNGMFSSALAFNQAIDGWNVSQVENMSNMFQNADAFNQDISGWVVTSVNTMASMFQSAGVFNQDISDWDVSSVQNMEVMFSNAPLFNNGDQPLDWENSGNTGMVADMRIMFQEADAFNQDVSGWDVSSVDDMSGMFYGTLVFNNGGQPFDWAASTGMVTNMNTMFYNADAFNQDISGWDVSSVIDMSQMFQLADIFNNGGQPLDWANTSQVTTLRQMFSGVSSFNQDVSSWDVSGVGDMLSVFFGASAFDQSLATWVISSASNISGMLSNSGMSTANYDATLIAWEAQNPPTGLSLGATGLNFCAAATAHAELQNPGTHNWTITDAGQQCAFITTWSTIDGEIRIPTTGTGYSYDITWTNLTNATQGDGSATSVGDTPYVISGLNNTDIYQIEITGSFPRIYFNNGLDKEKILSVEQWGDISWTTFEDAFYGCNNLVIDAIDAPDLSGVTSLRRTFQECTSLNQGLSNWDVSTITDMIGLFQGATSFNQDISGWNVGGVQFMNGMFMGATSFNQDISAWDVSSVSNMINMFRNSNFNQPIGSWTTSSLLSAQSLFQDNTVFNQDLNWDMDMVGGTAAMFWGATSFNGDISTWDVSSLVNMSSMFRDATSFDNDISGWVVSNVTNMESLFRGASVFNQEIGGWNTGMVSDMTSIFFGASAFNQDISGWTLTNVTETFSMFENATAFNQPLGSWNVSGVTDMSFMFSGATAFDQDLSSWDVSNTIDMSFMFNGASSFDQSLGDWDIGMMQFMPNMLDNSGLSIGNYDATLIGWEAQAPPSGLTLGAAGLSYCTSATAKAALEGATYSWTITDAGVDCSEAFIVTNTDDSGIGSLRWAIENANTVTGLDNITFNIPITDGNYVNTAGDERWTISPVTQYPNITEQVTIDATTQPGNGDYRISLDGLNSIANGFYVRATPSSFYGLYITGFTNAGIYAFVSGVGGIIVGDIAKGNVFNDCGTGIRSANAHNHVIKGNLIGTDETGTIAIPNGIGIGMGSGASNVIIGGSVLGEGNVISGNTGTGVGTNSASNWQIEGNMIGTNASGTVALPNAIGIAFGTSSGHTVTDNIIAGNTTAGIRFLNSGGTTIYGNNIGVGSNGTDAIGNGIGIYGSSVNNADNNIIGGTGIGEANIIANNVNQGILFENANHEFNRVIGNAIYANGNKGIDLNGVANGNKQSPLIDTYATGSVSGTGVDGDVIHVYRDNTGNAPMQGQEYLGTTTVASGVWTVAEASILPTDLINATATDFLNNTSEFAINFGEILVYQGADNTGTQIFDGQAGTIDMGASIEGTDLDQTFTIENKSSSTLTIFGAIAGAAPFLTIGVPASVPPNSSANFTVRLSGATAGVFNETITIASDDLDESVFDFPITGEITIGPPLDPTDLFTTEVSSTQIDLSWTDNAFSETGYTIERSDGNNSSFAFLDVIGVDATSYSDNSVTADNGYYYRVIANGSSGDSNPSNEKFGSTITPFGNALDFNGSDDHISFTQNPLGVGYIGSFSIEARVFATDLSAYNATYGGGIIRSANNESIGDYFLAVQSDGKVVFSYWDQAGDVPDGIHYSTNSISEDEWTHIGATYDGVNAKIYINGIEETLTTWGTNSGWGSGTEIGRSWTGGSYHWLGEIDEVRIWNDVRTQGELQTNLSSTLVGNEANLAAYYKFDQGVADGDNTAPLIDLLPDRSNNNNNGTLNNFDLNNETSNWVAPGAPPTTFYVDVSASGSNNGGDWTNAFTDLQSAISLAVNRDTIVVADGTYYPSVQINPEGLGLRESFQIPNGAKIYGGFAGGEDISLQSSFDNRDFETNRTILSGDLNQDSAPPTVNTGVSPMTISFNNTSDNSYHVVYGEDLELGTKLDGLTIQHGYNNGDGAGFTMEATSDFSDILFENCTFRWNRADRGAAIGKYDQNVAAPNFFFHLVNCLVTENEGITYGAIYLKAETFASVTNMSIDIFNSQFINNVANEGGALALELGYNANNVLRIYNSLFYGNDATGSYGAIAVYHTDGTFIANNTITDSYSGSAAGSGMMLWIEPIRTTSVMNNIIWNNESLGGDFSKQIEVQSGTLSIDFSLVQNGVSGIYENGGTSNFASGTNISDDPLFTDAANGDYTLLASSPAIDTGNDASVFSADPYDLDGDGDTGETWPLDLAGMDRIQGTVDMGAYETTAALPNAPTNLFVQEISGSQIDLTWDDNSSDETGYTIERSDGNNSSFAFLDVIGVDATSYSDNSVTADNGYYYRVIANGVSGDSSPSNAKFGSTITPPGNALDFDGVDDFVDLGDPTELEISGDITLEAWIYWDGLTATNQTIISRSEAGDAEANNILYQLQINSSSRLHFFFEHSAGVNQSIIGDESIPTGRWVHVVAVRDAAAQTVDLYLNGLPLTISDNTYPTNATGGTGASQKVLIAEREGSGGRYFDGRIDEVRVWNETRTPTEIQNNMFTVLVGNEANLAAYYRSDQGIAAGNNTTPAINLLPDRSINNNNGILNGFALNGNTSNWVAGFAPEPEIVVYEGAGTGGTEITAAQVTVIDLGTSIQGSDLFFDVTIENAGIANLNIASVTSSASEYTFIAVPTTVSAGLFSTFTIQLDASNAGTFPSTITVNNDDIDENPFTFPVTGTIDLVTTPEISVFQGTDNTGVEIFSGQGGLVQLGSTLQGTDLEVTFTLENTGVSDLNITTINSSDPAIQVIGAPLVVGAGLLAPFNLRLESSSGGVYSSTITIDNDDPDEGTFTFDVSGEVAFEEVVLKDGANIISVNSTIDLGETPRDEPIQRTFTLENPSSTETLSISNISIDDSGFQIIQEPSIILAGGSDDLVIELIAATTGTYLGAVSIESNFASFIFNISGEVVSRNQSIYVYNVVTPNGDGKHDFLKIDRITEHPGNRVTIFDRWGRKVFQGEDYDNDAVRFEGNDAEGNGSVLPEGTYYYVIITGSVKTTGFLHLSTNR